MSYHSNDLLSIYWPAHKISLSENKTSLIFCCMFFTSGKSNGETQPNGDHVLRWRIRSHLQSSITSFTFPFYFPDLFIFIHPSCFQAESRQLSSCGWCRAQVFSQWPEVNEQHRVSLGVIQASPTTQTIQTSSSNAPQTHLFTRSDIYLRKDLFPTLFN